MAPIASIEILPPGIAKHWFWGRIYEQRADYKWAAVAALLANAFAFLVSMFSMVVYDRVLPNAATDSLISLLAGAGMILALDYLVRQTRGYLIDKAGHRIDLALNKRIFEQFVLKWGATQGASTGVNATIVRELDSIREFVASATITTFVDIPFALLFVAVILFISGPLAFIPLATISAMLLVGFITHQRNKASAKATVEVSRLKSALVVECLTSREYIGTMPNVSYFSNRWDDAVLHHANQSDFTREVSNTATNLVNLLTQATQVAVISAGVFLESMTGVLVATTIMAGRAIAPFSQVVNLLSRFSQAQQSYKTIDKMMLQGKEAPLESPPVQLSAETLEGGIEFKAVTIAYPGKQDPVLKDISFKLEASDRLAILGKTGSGKTSLLRVLLGQAELRSGQVLFGGVSIEDIDKDSLHNRFSVLLQDNYLYKASILENISLSTEPPPADQIAAVLRRTTFATVLRGLPDGLKTDVGERGERLSGGQRRLLALSRAVFRPHTHLLLDEPTSGLDPLSERALVETLFSENPSCAAIFTTHRPAPLAWATKILVLDAGVVSDFGPRDEVLKRMQSK